MHDLAMMNIVKCTHQWLSCTRISGLEARAITCRQRNPQVQPMLFSMLTFFSDLLGLKVAREN